MPQRSCRTWLTRIASSRARSSSDCVLRRPYPVSMCRSAIQERALGLLLDLDSCLGEIPECRGRLTASAGSPEPPPGRVSQR